MTVETESINDKFGNEYTYTFTLLNGDEDPGTNFYISENQIEKSSAHGLGSKPLPTVDALKLLDLQNKERFREINNWEEDRALGAHKVDMNEAADIIANLQEAEEISVYELLGQEE